MAGEPFRTPPLTIEEFLEMEEASPTKHEYVDGEIFDYHTTEIYGLAGATAAHNLIAMNISALLWNAARGGPCRVLGSDMRLRMGDSRIYYPDVQVVCDPTDSEANHVRRPCLIVEVLSPSTESIDLREKWAAYRTLASLRAYLIVWRDEMRILEHYRAEEDQWFTAFHSRGSSFTLQCPEVRLNLDEIYEGIDLSD
jgi:Uma2 family endonuclease